jgi:hypothetical protein
VTVLNRGRTQLRPLAAGVQRITASTRDGAAVRAALGGRRFDVVAPFTALTPAQVKTDLGVFAGQAGQYINLHRHPMRGPAPAGRARLRPAARPGDRAGLKAPATVRDSNQEQRQPQKRKP